MYYDILFVNMLSIIWVIRFINLMYNFMFFFEFIFDGIYFFYKLYY